MSITTWLAILQQSEYDLPRFVKWVETHPHYAKNIEPENWTPKLKLIRFLYTVLVFLPPLSRIKVALALTQPGEFLLRRQRYSQAAQKLAQFREQGLVVVAVAGSYGKTSIKHQLQATIGRELPTLMTPKSINTMLGISQVIMSELQPRHKVFVTEIGEFKSGQVTELLNFIKPDYGILAPIGHQHIELLGSFTNIVAEFQDFAQFFSKQPQRLLVADTNQKLIPDSTYYGQSASADYRATDVHISRAGTEYQVNVATDSQIYKVFMPLYGGHQANNSLPAFWLASHLKIEPSKIAKHLAGMSYISRRHEPTFAQDNVLLLDNSYNTNPDSIQDSLKLLNELQATHRIMITAGFVEQGDEATQAHFNFGKLAATQLDYLGLFDCLFVDDITRGFVAGGGDKARITTGATQAEVVESLKSQIIPGSVVIFEGGHQEIHS